jgi:hypothetical protein
MASVPSYRNKFNGGPVYWPGHFNTAKNKLFFFVSVEDSPIKSPDGLKTYTVPTALEVAGNFRYGPIQEHPDRKQIRCSVPF